MTRKSSHPGQGAGAPSSTFETSVTTLPECLEPYALRARALAPVVLGDLWRRRSADAIANERIDAFLVAMGVVLRYEAALRADEQEISVREDLGPDALLALEFACRQLSSWRPARATQTLEDLTRAARELALRTVTRPTPVDLAARLSDTGDAVAVAERIEILDEADDVLSRVAARCFAGQQLERGVLRPVLPLASSLTRDLDDATRWRLESVVAQACNERCLWTDPFGWALWTAVAEPAERPRILAWLAQAAEPLAWQRPHVVAEADAGVPMRLVADGDQPELEKPGVANVLTWAPDTGTGRVVRVCVEYAPAAGVWGRKTELAPVAFNAIRCAYRAAAACLAGGFAPPLDHHRVTLDGRVRVDGDSLGLSLAIAFYSLWTNQPVPRGTAATGVVDPWTGSVREVSPRSLAAKVSAWRDQLGETGAPVLVPLGQSEGNEPARGVASVAGGLALLGLEPRSACIASAHLDVKSQKQRLRELVESPALPPSAHVEGANGWLLAAEEILVLVDALTRVEQHGIDLANARAVAALDYLHAGEATLAAETLRRIDPCPPRLELFHATVDLSVAIDRLSVAIDRLSVAIDRGALPEELDRLDQRIEALYGDQAYSEVERHWATGTRGRARMHAYLPGAVDLLEASVRSAPSWERARSRIYLSMALRQAQRVAEARGQVEAAVRDLEDTGRHDLAYAAATRGYLCYEAARVALADRRVEDAEACIQQALASPPAESDWWPRLGMMRVAAQVARLRGDTATAEARVAEAVELAVRAPEDHRGMVTRIVAEARGEEVDPPEVY